MVQVNYTKEKGLQQKSGSGSFSIESGIPLAGHVKDTISANTVALIDFSGIKQADGAAGALEFDLDSKVIHLASVGGTKFYIYFTVTDTGNTGDPVIAGKTGVQFSKAKADINSEAKLVDALVTLINDTGALNAEFEAVNDGNDHLKITALRMGNSGTIVTDISDFVGLVDTNNGDAVVNSTVTFTHGEGSHLLSTGGIAQASGALATAGDSFVVIPNLTENAHYGARKIVHRPANGQTFILKNSAGATLHTFDAAGEVAHLVWNGTSWQLLFGS
jgi:hypothetical protein